MEAALETQVSPRLAAREPLPCRGLLLGRLWPDCFRDDLASLHLPARTLALLSGEAEGWSPIEAAAVKIAHSLATVLAGRLRAGEAFVEAYRPDVAGLTGLGPGLTPTGDDLLVGLAATGAHSGADLLAGALALALGIAFPLEAG